MAGLRSDKAKFLRAFSPAEISSEMVSHCFLAQLNLSDTAGAAADYQFILDQGRLALISVQNRRQSPVLVDFFDRAFQRRLAAGGLHGQLMGKALGLKSLRTPTVLDATAGLGTDSYLMAHAGCLVTAIERSPAIFALLEDGLRRAVQAGCVQESASRSRAVSNPAGDFLLMDWPDKAYDVVYLDPMFPADRRKASSRKEMTMLQNIATEDQSESELLSQSLRCARRRVVVKRNRRSRELAGMKPTLKFQGSRLRFDVYCR